MLFSLGQFHRGHFTVWNRRRDGEKVEARNELAFAMIPLLFGIQQLTEGVIWLTFSHDAPLLKQAMTYLYSIFSHVLWPIYVPFAMDPASANGGLTESEVATRFSSAAGILVPRGQYRILQLGQQRP